MEKKYNLGLVWLRRDLRLYDNHALYQALKQCKKIYITFVFDTNIIENLPKNDKRISFIYNSLLDLNQQLEAFNSKIIILFGKSEQKIIDLANQLNINAIFSNLDYEIYSLKRDEKVKATLVNKNIDFNSYKDQVIFDYQEILNQQQKPYSVFTPYKKAWLDRFHNNYPTSFNYEICNKELSTHLVNINDFPILNIKPINKIEDIGFELQQLLIKANKEEVKLLFADFCTRIQYYKEARTYPAIKGVSYLSTYLRFGNISIRQLVNYAYNLSLHNNQGATEWLSELIWREFYMQIIANFSYVQQGKAFKAKYDNIIWREDEKSKQDFTAWCEGKTGYPIVDASMLQLNQTGYMHNRLRMISASFLVKNLGIDWRKGEAYFANKLLDFDFASNNGGWQWCASCGCDAQPYFRMFNPILQSQKFDEQGKFIKKYLPQLKDMPTKYIHEPWLAPQEILHNINYIPPIIDYKSSRQQTLLRYKLIV